MIWSIRGCYRGVVNYTPQVRLKWKFLWLAMFVALAAGGAGCGGVNAGQSVSPASFLLPGLMQVTPPLVVEGTNLIATLR
ncbi:MAG: hypothetical protein WCS94_17715 [Verrucomicrobiota bacterium]